MSYKIIIEIPEESAVKYEIDEETHELTIDRIMPTAMRFPFSYGAVAESLGEDGDPLDALVFLSQPVAPNVTVKCEIIGYLEMEDEGGIDHKLLAVPLEKIDAVCGSWKSIEDIPQARRDQIRHFFEHYKDLEPQKWVKLNDWKSKEEALALIEQAQTRFNTKINNQ